MAAKMATIIVDVTGLYNDLQIFLNTQKKLYENQANQKNTCQKIPESKISNSKNSSIIPIT